MREIKFRAWNKQNEEFMVIGKLFQEDDIYCVEEHPDEGDAYGFVGKDIVLMQYTGLKDNNDVEIYEGDIVHHYNDKVTNPFNGERNLTINKNSLVIFKKGSFVFKDGDMSIHYFLNEIEVIGNIYKNPELLKEEF